MTTPLETMYPPQKDSPTTYLMGDILSTDLTCIVSNAAVLPTEVPFPVTFGFDKTVTEVAIVTAVNLGSNQLTLTRIGGMDWAAGTKVARTFTASDLDAVQTNISILETEGVQKNIESADPKTVLDDTDLIGLLDSASAYVLKQVTLADLLAYMNLDPIYASLSNKQPLDDDLTAIASIAATTGLLKKTAANTWTLDTTAYITSAGAPVQSVNGKTGIVSLAKSDVGLGNVDNTSDLTKFASPNLTGVPVAPTAPADTNSTQIATTAFAKKEADDAEAAAKAYAVQRAYHTGSQAISTVTNLQSALDSKANLASPIFTGTVTLPTVSVGGKTISTTEFGYLDGVTSDIQTQLNTKANLASPALTGTPTAPTQAAGNNSTRIATTQYVQTELANVKGSRALAAYNQYEANFDFSGSATTWSNVLPATQYTPTLQSGDILEVLLSSNFYVARGSASGAYAKFRLLINGVAYNVPIAYQNFGGVTSIAFIGYGIKQQYISGISGSVSVQLQYMLGYAGSSISAQFASYNDQYQLILVTNAWRTM